MTNKDHDNRTRFVADRLILASSLLLVVLTVIFSTFMSAEKFWQGQAIEIQIKETEDLSVDARRALDTMRERYDADHRQQAHYGQVFAGIMSAVMLLTAICYPIGVWKESTPILKVVTVGFVAALGALCVYGFGFAFGWINP
jgi:hypothetical protein